MVVRDGLSPTRTLHPIWGNFRVGGDSPGTRKPKRLQTPNEPIGDLARIESPSLRYRRTSRSARLTAESVTHTKHFSDMGMIFHSLDENLGNVCARNLESEKRQIPLPHTIPPRSGLSVSWGGRTIVQSRPLSTIVRSIADASATTPGKDNLPTK